MMFPCSLLSLIFLACAYAAPTVLKVRTLPLTKIPVARDNEHSLIAYQRHHNTAVKRHAYMSGGQAPSEKLLQERMMQRAEIVKRLYFLPSPPNSTPGKRLYFSPAYPPPRPGAVGTGFKINLAVAPEPQTLADAPEAHGTVLGSAIGGFSRIAQAADIANEVTPSQSELSPGSLDYQIQANDIGYLANVQLGTPPQEFLILMDSGSADTWVGASNCAVCGPQRRLGTDVSSSFVESAKPFSVRYGTGEANGLIVTDTLSIAGMTLPALTMGVATNESVEFSSPRVPFDGLMGLALSGLSKQKTPTPIEALAESGLVPAGIMGYKLGRIADGLNDGEITFGGVDPAKFDASTTQTLPNTGKTGFWQAEMSAVTVNGVPVLRNRQAIMDTGTSLIIAPAADAEAFHNAIPGAASDGQGGFTLPCNSSVTVTMTFGSLAFQMDTRDLAFLPLTRDPRGQCMSSISSGTIADDVTWLVGDSFLKNVYFSTNVDDNTMSISALARAQTVGSVQTAGVNSQPLPAATLDNLINNSTGNVTGSTDASPANTAKSMSPSFLMLLVAALAAI